MKIPKDLLYTKDHEWSRFEGNIVTVGITDFAQSELGDIIFVEFPEVGQEVQKDNPFGTIEAVKTVTDLYAPVSGEVIELNEKIEDAPEQINSDPYGEGWIVKIRTGNLSEKRELISPAEYESLIG